MEIFLNGKPKNIADATTLEGLLNFLKLETAHVAVELNQEVVTKTAFPDTNLKAGDNVEVVHFVGGG
jgi:thiamine biosynthesis protein ThiS